MGLNWNKLLLVKTKPIKLKLKLALNKMGLEQLIEVGCNKSSLGGLLNDTNSKTERGQILSLCTTAIKKSNYLLQ